MKIVFVLLALFIISGVTIAEAGQVGLGSYLQRLDSQAKNDLNVFSSKLSSHFGVPESQVRTVISTVKKPSHAFVCLQLSQWTQKPIEQVVEVYKANNAWTAILEKVGIKPESAEFRDMKDGNFKFSGSKY